MVTGGSVFFRGVFGKPFTFHRHLSRPQERIGPVAPRISKAHVHGPFRTLERMPVEKRRAKRRQIGQRVWVDFGPGSRVQPCVLKDMSDVGAG
jgi:hypothetical protein